MFATNSFRSSLGGGRPSDAFGLSFSQEEATVVKPRRGSVDGTAPAQRRALECGVAPAPISYLYRCQEKGSVKLFGSSEVCPASLVGIPHQVKMPSDALIQFLMTDGTGVVLVKMDLPSEQPWLRPTLLEQLPPIEEGGESGGSENRPPVVKPVRVVGIPESEPNSKLISLRALHIREAFIEEYAYYHTILSCSMFAKMLKQQPLEDNGTIVLPKRFDKIYDQCQRWVIATILERREESLGLLLETLVGAGKATSYQEPEIRAAVTELDSAGHVIVIDGDASTFVDIMPED